MEKFDNNTVVVKLFYISSIVCYLAISCDISHNEFECSDGTCIPEYWYCDAYVDCEDGGDEANCLLECLTDEKYAFMCNDGFCIYNEWICDNETDCSENEDEENCQETETTQTSENELTTETKHRFSTTIGYNFTILSKSTTPALRKSGEMTGQTKSMRTTNDHLISEDFQTTTTSLPLTTTDHTTTTIDIVQPTTDHTTTSIGVVQQITDHTTTIIDIVQQTTEHTTTIIDIVQPTTDHTTTIIDIVQQIIGHTTANIDVVQQITTIADVSSFQENKEAQHGKVEDSKTNISGIIGGSSIVLMISLGVLMGAVVFVKYRHHKQRTRRVNILPLQQTN